MKNLVHPIAPVLFNLRFVIVEVLTIGPFLKDWSRILMHLIHHFHIVCLMINRNFELRLTLSVLQLLLSMLLSLVWAIEKILLNGLSQRYRNAMVLVLILYRGLLGG